MANYTIKANIKAAHIKPVDSRIVVTKTGVFPYHIEYLAKNRLKSISWRDKSCSALVKFLDYADAFKEKYPNPRVMFEAFAEQLDLGTIDRLGNDPTGLFWEPIKLSTINNILYHLTTFSEFVAKKSDNVDLLLNPTSHATYSEKMINLAAYHHRKNNSFFAHTYNDRKALKQINKSNHTKSSKKMVTSKHKATSESVIVDLISSGFWRRKKRNSFDDLNIKNVLITILTTYGGLRVSEPFHFFTSDIYEDPEDPDLCFLRVEHPVEGICPKYYRKNKGIKNREQYLMQKYGLEPSKEGYKSKVESFDVYIFPRVVNLWFKRLLDIYVNDQRVYNPKRPHPYLFTDEKGNPATKKYYCKARNKALDKLGYDTSKYSGNNPHGGRHFYGDMLAMSDLDPLLLKVALHHSSLKSQETYTEKAIERKLKKALAAIDTTKGALEESTSDMSQVFLNDISTLKNLREL